MRLPKNAVSGLIQVRGERYVIVDLVGKGKDIRTVPVPMWTKRAVDEWTTAAGINFGDVTSTDFSPSGTYATFFVLTFSKLLLLLEHRDIAESFGPAGLKPTPAGAFGGCTFRSLCLLIRQTGAEDSYRRCENSYTPALSPRNPVLEVMIRQDFTDCLASLLVWV